MFYTILLFLIQTSLSFADINGCGGFLKSSIPIDFSKVNVKLYSKVGVLKDSTDCAPNNGYYFLPIYDKGEYILKIEPPTGWHFEPKEVPINYDGTSDSCSQGNDINFEFKGFSINGKVLVRGCNDGPENIKVSLLSDKNVLVTSTSKNGHFKFSPILPGRYKIKATQNNVVFVNDEISHNFQSDSLKISDGALLIAGYNVKGQVLSNGDPVKDINIYLFGPKNGEKPLNCFESPESKKSGAVCQVKTDTDGIFIFESVPFGNYRLRPSYASFDFEPREMEFNMGFTHQVLSEPFTVKGFSVKGRVLNKENGAGLPGVEIYINGRKVAVSDDKGIYQLDRLEPSSYTITAKGDKMRFSELSMKLTATAGELSPLIPNKWLICGRVLGTQSSRVIEIKGSKNVETVTKESGEFCEFLERGTHLLSVRLTEEEASKGLVFMPVSKEIVVTDSPFDDLEFSQLLGTIKGQISLFSKNIRNPSITLKLRNSQSVIKAIFLNSEINSYTFPNTLPGSYEIEIESPQLCFNGTKTSITVSSAETIVPSFIQTGFRLKIYSSHATRAVIAPLGEISLNRGENSLCVPNTGIVELQPKGCHGYEKSTYKIDMEKEESFKLNAISHDITGYAYLTDDVDFFIEVSSLGRLVAKLGPLRGKRQKSDDSYEVSFTVRMAENQQLEFVPAAEQMIFNPELVEFRSRDDCVRHAVTVYGERGIIIDGVVNPTLADVQISLKLEESGMEITQMTDEKGRYSFGPLKRSSQYTLTAFKDSYVFTGPDENHNFYGHKLAEVRVLVSDNNSLKGLSGVLLSLTGGDKYRKNSITGESGDLSFTSLSPGEYFLRPMMKEYKFEPASFIIELGAGETKTIKVTGRRVAYTLHGTVTTLTNEPEPNVSIEALGINGCSNHQEETTSEAPNGVFRLRGLQPGCEYRIGLKKIQGATSVYRIEPEHVVIKATNEDIYGVKLIGFEKIGSVDLSVLVNSDPVEHLKTLTVLLIKEDSPNQPVSSIRLDTLYGGAKNWGSGFIQNGLLVQLPFIPKDANSYFIRVETSLSSLTHSIAEPSVHFVANETFSTFRLKFRASLKMHEQESVPKHYLGLIILVLSVVLFFGKNSVIQFGYDLLGYWNGARISEGEISDRKKAKSRRT